MPGAADVMGVANATATVTVNNQATYRRGEFYRKELALNNAAAERGQFLVLNTLGSKFKLLVMARKLRVEYPGVFIIRLRVKLRRDRFDELRKPSLSRS